jgi:hypothetical protein
MASEAQVTANRLNAAKSTGPRTPQGKEIVAQNALKHGLLARRDVIAGEDQEEFDLHRSRLLADLAPGRPVESLLAEQIVSLSWRLRRAAYVQNQVFDYLVAREIEDALRCYGDVLSVKDQEEIEKNTEFNLSLAVGRTVALDCWKEKVLDRLQLYERRIESSLCRIMRELEHLGRRRKPEHAEGEAVSEVSGVPIRVEGAPRVADETPATQPPTDCAKQSQSRVADTEETQNLASLQADDATRGGREGMADCAEQSQFPAADGGHRPPCETGVDHPTPHGQTSLPMPPSDCAKQSQLAGDRQ